MDSKFNFAGVFLAAALMWALSSQLLHAQAPTGPAQSAAEAAGQVATDTVIAAKKVLNEIDKDDEATDTRRHEHDPYGPLIPFATFAFVLIVVLGTRFMRGRTDRHKIELMKLMVEKGQPIPEAFFTAQLSSHPFSRRGVDSPERQMRNGFTMTFAGLGLLAFALFSAGPHQTVLILGLVFSSMGLGTLLARKFGSTTTTTTAKPN